MLRTSLISFILLSLSFLPSVFAAPTIGTIIKVKGKVTGLFPGAQSAVKIKKGMKVKEDTSLLSHKRSFAKVKLIDGSKLILGPESKLIVSFPKESNTGIISLLKGKVRSQVNKDSNKIKQVIQTKSAALGVRGTDFQATFNPINRMTSLVTYTGKVAMIKKTAKTEAKLRSLKMKKKKRKSRKRSKRKKKVKLDSLFAKEAVLVEPGSYSAVSDNLKKATTPVNLNPKQFSILKANDTFVRKKISKKELAKEEKKIKKILAKRAKKKKAKAGATFNIKTGSYKPKDGGYIDLETGIYVPPAADSKFDEKLNIYVDKNADKRISGSGNFKAPKGLKLDAKKGFVAINSSKEAQNKVKELNKEIAGQIIKPRKPSFDELESIDEDDAYDKFFKTK